MDCGQTLKKRYDKSCGRWNPIGVSIRQILKGSVV